MDPVLCLENIVRKAQANKEMVDALLFDVEKAYDIFGGMVSLLSLKAWESVGGCLGWYWISLNVGYGICETPADFEITQLKLSYPLSFNADSDYTHSK